MAYNKTEFIGRSDTSFDETLFSQELNRITWELFYANNDPQLGWQYLQDKIRNILDKMCPLRKFRFSREKTSLDDG